MKRNLTFSFLIIILISLCSSCEDNQKLTTSNSRFELIVLGNAQDAGAPHIACIKACCKLMREKGINHPVVSLGLIDQEKNKYWLFEATPDISNQLKIINEGLNYPESWLMPSGIFITHAHIGHYTGLMYLGREAMNAKNITVYCMQRMKEFLENNGPWSQLVQLNNISLQQIENLNKVTIDSTLWVMPILIPHRDEFSETVGYKIGVNGKIILFIPDIDKWSNWNLNILEEIKNVDMAFLDATFYNEKEIPGRDISEIPHPFVVESIEILKELDQKERSKVVFIHFNHSNPLLDSSSTEFKSTLSLGFNIAQTGQKYPL